MVGLLKKIEAFFVALVVIFSVSVNAAAFSDDAEWENSKLCVFLEANGESNSDLCFAAVKVRYDMSVHRVYLLFMLEFEDFNDDKLSGVIMNFNGLGAVKIISDGTADYNDDIYFAELNDEIADTHSMNVLLEVTVGIKAGIPENLTMDVNVIDTNGVKSNTFSVDISEETDEESDDAETTNKSSTASAKSTKTTKAKTTKTKTTKTKTTKANKSATQNDDEDEEAAQTVIISDGDDGVSTENNRKKLTLILGAAAALAALAAGCAVGIKNKKKDENKEHTD